MIIRGSPTLRGKSAYAMRDSNVVGLVSPASQARDALTEVLTEGGQRLLAGAVEDEVDACLKRFVQSIMGIDHHSVRLQL